MSDREFTIKVNTRQLGVAVSIVVVVLFSLYRVVDHVHKVRAAKSALISTFQESSRALRRELLDNPAIAANKEWHHRFAKAAQVLHSTCFDSCVLLFDLRVVESDPNMTRLLMRYVDEQLRVTEIRYSQAINSNGTGVSFLRSEDMPPKHIRMFGVTDLAVPIRPGRSDNGPTLPHEEIIDQQDYWILDADMYASIVSRQGCFLLVDATGQVLDSVGFESFATACTDGESKDSTAAEGLLDSE